MICARLASPVSGSVYAARRSASSMRFWSVTSATVIVTPSPLGTTASENHSERVEESHDRMLRAGSPPCRTSSAAVASHSRRCFGATSRIVLPMRRARLSPNSCSTSPFTIRIVSRRFPFLSSLSRSTSVAPGALRSTLSSRPRVACSSTVAPASVASSIEARRSLSAQRARMVTPVIATISPTPSSMMPAALPLPIASCDQWGSTGASSPERARTASSASPTAASVQPATPVREPFAPAVSATRTTEPTLRSRITSTAGNATSLPRGPRWPDSRGRLQRGSAQSRPPSGANPRPGGAGCIGGERPRWDSNPRMTDLQSVPLVHLGTRPADG